MSRVGVSVEEHRKKNKTADEWLVKMAGPLVTVLDPTELLSDQTGLCRAELGGYAMYRDAGHLSDEGGSTAEADVRADFSGGQSTSRGCIGSLSVISCWTGPQFPRIVKKNAHTFWPLFPPSESLSMSFLVAN